MKLYLTIVTKYYYEYRVLKAMRYLPINYSYSIHTGMNIKTWLDMVEGFIEKMIEDRDNSREYFYGIRNRIERIIRRKRLNDEIGIIDEPARKTTKQKDENL